MEDQKKWTIMIYMAGDNNLSADMAYALADIREAMKGKKDSINLMVFYDGAADNAPTMYCNFTDFDNPFFCPANLVTEVFEHKNPTRDEPRNFNKNSGAVYSLMNFINWCVNDTKIKIFDENGDFTEMDHHGKPAEKYALIFSGHSSAFQNLSLMIDASSNYFMSIPKLRWALERIVSQEGFRDVPLLQQKIDILGFDSCVMGMAELAFEFRKAAKTLVASEGNLPSAGWSYGSILSRLICPENGKPMTDEKAVAAGFVETFIERQSDFLIGGVSVDIAALDLDEAKVQLVIERVNNLAINLGKLVEDPASEGCRKVKNALLLTHLECQSYMSEQNVDLRDFCEVLQKYIKDDKETENLVSDCHGSIEAIDDCVLLSGFGGGTYQFSNGMAVFFPWTEVSYLKARENYEDLRACRPDGPMKDWNLFLQRFTKLTLRPARINLGKQLGLADKVGLVNKMSGNGTFFPTKNNGVANDKSVFMVSLRNNGVANDKNTHIGNDKNTHVGNDKNTHNGNDKNTHVGNDKNTHVGNDKNTHIGNDKNTHIGNDKGLLQLLMAQFKNTDSPWNISGFTKAPIYWKKVEEVNRS